MKALIALCMVLGSCMYTVQPKDILAWEDNDTLYPAPVYCQPLNDFVWRCRIYTGKPFLCTHSGGRWRCELDRLQDYLDHYGGR